MKDAFLIKKAIKPGQHKKYYLTENRSLAVQGFFICIQLASFTGLPDEISFTILLKPSLVFDLGNGVEGTGTFKKLHNGSQPVFIS